MYKSPIEEIRNQMIAEVMMNYENGVMKAVYEAGFYVNKDELLKALQYDRNQYDKGYEDGYTDGIDRLVEALRNECSGNLYKSVWSRKIDEVASELKGQI